MPGDNNTIKEQLKKELTKRIKFYEDIAKNYPLNDDVFEEYREVVEKLKEKVEDEKINFAVIGEFSTGKSTFVNAFIKSPFLESKVLQGTTAAATVIEYGDEYKAALEYNDLTKNTLRFTDSDEMKSVVNEYTVNCENTQKIKKVTFTLADIKLDKHMRIVDTPGINVEYSRHEEVTRYSINSICDVPIVLIDATKALPESLIDFLYENIGDKIDYSVFIVTKIDCVKEKEIEDIVKYVKIKLMQEFELSKPPVVLPYAALQVLENSTLHNTSHIDESMRKLLAISQKTENALIAFFNKNHLSYLAKSFKYNEAIVCRELKSAIESYRDNFYNMVNLDEESIETSRGFLPEYFKSDQKQWRVKSFNQSCGKIHADLSNRMQYIKNSFISRTNFDIHNNPFVKKSAGKSLNGYFAEFFANQVKIFIDECQRYFDLLKGKYVYEMYTFLRLYKKTCSNISVLLPQTCRKEFYDYMKTPNPEFDTEKYADYIKNEIESLFASSYSNSLIKTSLSSGIRTKSGEVIDFATKLYSMIISDIMKKMSDEIETVKQLILEQIDKTVREHKDFIADITENLTQYMIDFEDKRDAIDNDLYFLTLRL